MLFIKNFDDNNIPNSIEELKKIYKKFIENNHFDDFTGENIKEHKANWPQIPGHLYKILITGGSGSGKTNCITFLYVLLW